MRTSNTRPLCHSGVIDEHVERLGQRPCRIERSHPFEHQRSSRQIRLALLYTSSGTDSDEGPRIRRGGCRRRNTSRPVRANKYCLLRLPDEHVEFVAKLAAGTVDDRGNPVLSPES